MPGFFVLRKLNRCPSIAFAFFVEKASTSLVSVLTPIAKSGLKRLGRSHRYDPAFSE